MKPWKWSRALHEATALSRTQDPLRPSMLIWAVMRRLVSELLETSARRGGAMLDHGLLKRFRHLCWRPGAWQPGWTEVFKPSHHHKALCKGCIATVVLLRFVLSTVIICITLIFLIMFFQCSVLSILLLVFSFFLLLLPPCLLLLPPPPFLLSPLLLVFFLIQCFLPISIITVYQHDFQSPHPAQEYPRSWDHVRPSMNSHLHDHNRCRM